MDRKNFINFIVLPYLYFTFLSTGMILACGYLLTSTRGPVKTYAQELSRDDAIQVNLSKDVDNQIEVIQSQTDDIRAKKIDAYFAKLKNPQSPLVGYGKVFVAEADKNQIDWRLLPAIAMAESGGGRSKTANFTNNIFGWGFNDDANKNDPSVNIHDSFDHGIKLVSEKIRSSYYDKGLQDIEEIVTKYNPGSVDRAGGKPEDATWTKQIKGFMQSINDIEL